ncbi:DoxX family protein [Roseococcus sp. YIM B11640]|uniref:DoxX family protein n=1 Tax=Roseococcus sp. YIM B11640 TaxID=3133973 RepID=UPI003C7DDD55
MMFFAFLVLGSVIAAVASRVGLPGLADWTSRMRWAMAVALLFFGLDHLLVPGRYLPMLPSALPAPEALVLFTGLCEIGGGLGLLIPRLRRLAAIMLSIYFVCVFPANVRNALGGLSVSGLPDAQWYYWLRLPFQPLAIWWALYAGEVITWPQRQRDPGGSCRV